MGQILIRMHNLKTRSRRMIQHPRKRPLRPALHQDVLLKLQPRRIRKQQRLLQQQRSPRQHRRIAHIPRTIAQLVPHLRHVLQRLARIPQHVVGKAHHRLPFQHGLASRIRLINPNMLVVLCYILRNRQNLLVAPLRQPHPLILQSMGQLMRHHRLLLVRRNPVQQRHRLRLVVIEPGNLLGQQAQQKRPHLEALIQQPKLLQHQLIALHALGALVFVKLLPQHLVHVITRRKLPLDRMLDLQPRILAHKRKRLVHLSQQRTLIGLRHHLSRRLPRLQLQRRPLIILRCHRRLRCRRSLPRSWSCLILRRRNRTLRPYSSTNHHQSDHRNLQPTP